MPSTVIKPEYIRELGPVDIAHIKELVSRLPDQLWEIEDARKENQFLCFHHTRHIIFRFSENFTELRRSYSKPIWTVWQNRLVPILEQVVAPYNFRLNTYPRVMLARLAAGYAIDRHRDGEGAFLFTHKIHIPIQTNDRASFFIKDKSFHLQEGFAYEVNNLDVHAAENLGETDRIHLIFEVFDDASD
jgi:hypothetical protein